MPHGEAVGVASDVDAPTSASVPPAVATTSTPFLDTTLTEEELAELHLALSSAGGASNKRRALRAASQQQGLEVWGSGDQAQEQAQEEDDSTPPREPQQWDKERVFLVGVDVWGSGHRGGNGSTSAAGPRNAQQQGGNGSSATAATTTNGDIGNGSSNGSSNGGGALVAPASAGRANGRGKKGGGGSAGRPAVAHTYTVHESLEELSRLSDTAGLEVVGSTYQSIEVPNNATFIGSGKVAEVARAVRALQAETVIFDCELSPGQLRNLEKAFAGDQGAEGPGVRVADRTALILDIFNQRAATREGKLQVELAQVEYQLPRLTRMWTHLDRVGGGGQVKGAGEKQIEMDKRILRDRAAALRKELEAVRGHRRAYRQRRAVAPIPVVALVGYTNAGKSTLLNRLTDAGVLAEDKLFATLDPTTRKIRMRPGNREVLLTDTVGFIQKLPTELVAAFRATLEEVQDASVLLHLVDISHPNAAAQCDAVLQVLDELGVSHVPLVTAWNKLDACPDPAQVRKVASRRRDTVCLSGRTGEGLEGLMALITDKLSASMTEVEVCLPYAAGDLLDDIHRAGELLSPPDYTDSGVLVSARVPSSLAGRLRQYSLRQEEAAVVEEEALAREEGGLLERAAGEFGSGNGTGWDSDESEWAAFPVTLPPSPAKAGAA